MHSGMWAFFSYGHFDPKPLIYNPRPSDPGQKPVDVWANLHSPPVNSLSNEEGYEAIVMDLYRISLERHDYLLDRLCEIVSTHEILASKWDGYLEGRESLAYEESTISLVRDRIVRLIANLVRSGTVTFFGFPLDATAMVPSIGIWHGVSHEHSVGIGRAWYIVANHLTDKQRDFLRNAAAWHKDNRVDTCPEVVVC